MAIWTLPSLKSALGLAEGNAEWDDLLNLLISSTQAFLEQEIGCPLDYQAYEESEIRGEGTNLLYLPSWPAEDVTSLVDENGCEYVLGIDYELYQQDGVLVNLNGIWIGGLKYIATFTAGYDFGAGEGSDLKAMALDLIAKQWKRYKDKSFGESGRTFPEGTINYLDLNLTDKEKRLLQIHRRIRI